MAPPPYLHLAVALDGAGWHPGAWREEDARPAALFSPAYWVDLVQEAERGLLDFVSIEDSLAIQSNRRGRVDARTDQVRGRLDAVLVASRVAPLTSAIGIMPVATTTHTEPFNVSRSLATLDFVSNGRAGVQLRVSASALEADQFGRRTFSDPAGAGGDDPGPVDSVHDLFAEAADFIEVVRRLWDSWEDDAEIRDARTGRFVDREKLHYIDFEGKWFSVKGPSVTPRPPQGHPVISVLAHVPVAFELAARGADLVFTTPVDADDARTLVDTIHHHEGVVSRAGSPVRIFADLVVFLDESAAAAQARKDRLDAADGRVTRYDATVFAGTPGDLADLLLEWQAAGIEGFRLRPGAIPHDLDRITRELVPILQHGAAFRKHYGESTLRARLGLPLVPNRYATA
jgi:alkanesulfonate monooxygenase SsuD/methylene tetrahydromethanopterin reductase-like flavin-dependent oxidoreductase (luciferase family)